MSAALSRLRTLLGDPLFQRNADGLVPTPRARDLAARVDQALAQQASGTATADGPAKILLTLSSFALSY
jgi:DNA-binding transcriptional LysR family regulator